ncbi:putative Stress-induced-phosphoprotein 1 [Paratrimastix pyriformis]|uniref:Stress-induced-phosphoprotein 1 n=1 Tax=Paratrimastix pyriformis TaxID=342808 RepID=A0ABQ8UND4_9EUKA|nr:putative Stress-induced-phosphoprotein 1 [Paratrimastix pyriformis]
MATLQQRKEQATKAKEEGNVAYTAGNYSVALECYTRAIDLDPNNPVYRSNRAATYFQLNMFQQAVDDSQWAIELSPTTAKFYFRKGAAHEKLGQLYEARLAYTNGLRQDPGNHEIQAALAALPPPGQCRTSMAMEERKNKATAFKEQGNAAFTQRQWAPAAEAYTKAIEMDPAEMVYYNNRSACYLELNELEKAVADAQRAAEIGKTTGAPKRLLSKAYTRLGEGLRRLGRKPEAADAYRKALAEEESDQIRQKLAEVTRA